MKNHCLLLTIGVALAGCQPAWHWQAPPGTSGRQVNQDMATCRVASGLPEAFAIGDIGFVAVASDNYAACLQRAGYTKAVDK